MSGGLGATLTAALREALRFGFGRIARIYFREIEVAGEVPTAETGGRLFGANHVNALVDPILVLTQAPCPISPIAKSTLWNIPGLRFVLDAADAVPIVRRRDDPTKSEGDNDAVFSRVAGHLAGGGNILIFPEGTSHNEPRLLALRSGAGRMLARARKESPSALTFQAVALEFDRRDVFRSRCLVLFGPVRHVAEVAENAGSDDEVAKRITDTLRRDLSDLLVEAESWDARVLLVRAAEMFANDAGGPSLTEVNALGRRIEEAREALRASEPDTVARIEGDVRAYFEELDALGLTDADVARTSPSNVATPRASSAALSIVTLPLAVAGIVLYWLPYQLPRLVTRRLGGEGDIASTYKLGVGLLVFPLWAVLLVTAALLALPAPWDVALAAVALVGPFAALPWVDRLDTMATRARLLAPREVTRERVAALAEHRAGLMQRLDEARARAEQVALGA